MHLSGFDDALVPKLILNSDSNVTAQGQAMVNVPSLDEDGVFEEVSSTLGDQYSLLTVSKPSFNYFNKRL